jgi:ABC-type multidrug transport system fused ATPase/permease subunit
MALLDPARIWREWNARPIAPIARRYMLALPIAAVLGFVASAMEGVSISFVVPLLSLLSPGSYSPPTSGLLGTISNIPLLFAPDARLVATAVVMLALVVLKAIIQTVNGIFVGWVNQTMSHRIRAALAAQLVGVGYRFFLKTEPARLVNLIATESWRATEAIASIFWLVVAGGTVAVFSILLALISWPLFLGVLAGALVFRMAQAALRRRALRASEEVTEANNGLARRTTSLAIDLPKIVRLFGREEHELNSFTRASDVVRRGMIKAEALHTSVGPYSEVSQSILFVVILLVATRVGIELPTLIAFLVLLYRMQPSLRQLSMARVAFATLSASLREVEWLLRTEDKPRAPTGDTPIASIGAGIVFDNVSYAYDGPEAKALEGVTFEVPAGRTTALVGPSGAGKSTIINLLFRLIEPSSGTIRIGGEDIARIDPASLRRLIGIAGQDVDFFEGTIADNIGYGAEGATREQIVAAAAEANAAGFIAELPLGYDTTIGARGIGLSGGQRQRLALARALLRNPQVLILDEATNAVDEETERTIMARIREGRPSMTVLVVSHRPSALATADNSISVEGGRVRVTRVPIV